MMKMYGKISSIALPHQGIHVVPDMLKSASPSISADFDFPDYMETFGNFNQEAVTQLANKNWTTAGKAVAAEVFIADGEVDSRVPIKPEPLMDEDDLSVDVADLMTYAPTNDLSDPLEVSSSPSSSDDEEEEEEDNSYDSDNGFPLQDVDYSPSEAAIIIPGESKVVIPHSSLTLVLDRTSLGRRAKVQASPTVAAKVLHVSRQSANSSPASSKSIGKSSQILRGKARPRTKEELEAKKERLRIRQEKNRQAAKKCRERKQQYYAELEAEVKNLRSQNAKLTDDLRSSRRELSIMYQKYQEC